MKNFDWFNLNPDFFASKEVKELRQEDKGDRYVIIYLKILLLSRHASGYLFFENVGNTLADEVAMEIGEDLGEVFHTMSYLQTKGLIEYPEPSIAKVICPRQKRYRQSVEYRAWRTAVYERDSYTCQRCGQRGVSLEAHHIEPWATCPEKRFVVSNGVTLCKECHRKLHRGEFDNEDD